MPSLKQDLIWIALGAIVLLAVGVTGGALYAMVTL